MPDIELSRWQGNVGVEKLLDAGFYISIFSGDIHIQSKLRTVFSSWDITEDIVVSLSCCNYMVRCGRTDCGCGKTD